MKHSELKNYNLWTFNPKRAPSTPSPTGSSPPSDPLQAVQSEPPRSRVSSLLGKSNPFTRTPVMARRPDILKLDKLNEEDEIER